MYYISRRKYIAYHNNGSDLAIIIIIIIIGIPLCIVFIILLLLLLLFDDRVFCSAGCGGVVSAVAHNGFPKMNRRFNFNNNPGVGI